MLHGCDGGMVVDRQTPSNDDRGKPALWTGTRLPFFDLDSLYVMFSMACDTRSSPNGGKVKNLVFNVYLLCEKIGTWKKQDRSVIDPS